MSFCPLTFLSPLKLMTLYDSNFILSLGGSDSKKFRGSVVRTCDQQRKKPTMGSVRYFHCAMMSQNSRKQRLISTKIGKVSPNKESVGCVTGDSLSLNATKSIRTMKKTLTNPTQRLMNFPIFMTKADYLRWLALNSAFFSSAVRLS